MNDPQAAAELATIQAATGGDEVAFDAVVKNYAARLRWLIRMRLDPSLRARVSADDVLQEVMLVVSNQIRSLVVDNEGAFWSWLCRVVEQRLIDARRRHLQAAARDARREQAPPATTGSAAAPLDALLRDDGASPSAKLKKDEQREAIGAALDRLPDSYREVIILRMLEGLSVDETAQIMGRSNGAISVLLTKAVKRLGEEISLGGGRS